jgi:hypothetical protein
VRKLVREVVIGRCASLSAERRARLREQPDNIDDHVGSQGGDERSIRQPLPRGIPAIFRLTINLDRDADEIDDPDLRNAEPRVKRKLHAAIVGERSFRDFDQQENVGGARMTRAVIVGAARKSITSGSGSL